MTTPHANALFFIGLLAHQAQQTADALAANRDRLTVRDGGTKRHRPKVRTVKPDAMPKVLREAFADFPNG